MKLHKVLIMSILSIFISIGVFASSQDVNVVINDEVLDSDVPAQVINQRTLVPIRAITETLGAEVEWDGDTNTVTIHSDNTIKLVINSNIATVNGKKVTLDQPAVAINNRTMIPLRFISESMGAKVEWDGTNNTAVINSTSTIKVKIDSNTASVNGKQVTLDQSAMLMNNITMVPLRFISESIGAEVGWDSYDDPIFINGINTIKVTIDSNIATIDGKPVRLDQPATVINNRTMVPLRFISESMDAKVEWNNNTQTATIKTVNNTDISHELANNILVTKFAYQQPDVWYEYMPSSSYAHSDQYVINNYHIFAIQTPFEDVDEYGNITPDYTTADSNYCVHKKTGEVEWFVPGLGFVDRDEI